MPIKKYLINLTQEEHEIMLGIIGKGVVKARQMNQVRRRFFEDGLERALKEYPRPAYKHRLDGRAEAQLIATACKEAPKVMSTGLCVCWQVIWSS